MADSQSLSESITNFAVIMNDQAKQVDDLANENGVRRPAAADQYGLSRLDRDRADADRDDDRRRAPEDLEERLREASRLQPLEGERRDITDGPRVALPAFLRQSPDDR